MAADRRIVGARLLEVSVPLRVPFTISGGTLDERRSLIVELQDEQGQKGFGEAAPFAMPFYSEETVSSVRLCLEEMLLPRVIGRSFEHGHAVYDFLSTCGVGNRMAKAAVDTAWWHLEARARHVSLAVLVGERLQDLGVPGAARQTVARVACGAALGIPAENDTGELARAVGAALERGFRRLKLKIRPGWCSEPVAVARAVCKEHSLDPPIWVDGNGSFDPDRHRDELTELDRYDLVCVEQPFPHDSWWDSTKWNQQAVTPICLDETLTSDSVARQIVAMGGPMIWNLKVQRMGGLEESCRVYARGIEVGAKMWVGTMPETGLGAQAALALAALPGCVLASDLAPSDWWYQQHEDLVDVEMDTTGYIRVPSIAPPLPKANRVVPIASFQ